MAFGRFDEKRELPIHNRFHVKKKQSKSIYAKFIALAAVIALIFWLFPKRHGDTSSGQLTGTLLDEPKEKPANLYKVTGNKVEKQEIVQGVRVEERPYDDIVEYHDLNNYKGSKDGGNSGDVVLLLMPLRNAEHVLPMAFYNLMNLTYDHSLIDVAFLVSDCSPDDTTLETVFEYSTALQNGTLAEWLHREEAEKNAKLKGTTDLYKNYMDPAYIENVRKSYANPASSHKDYRKPFRSISIYQKDFGQVIGQGFSDRHAVKVQGIRRKLMGRARNWLTANALQPYHSWVYWRDVDVETSPGCIIQDLMKHDYDVMVPNIWRPLPTFLGGEQPYDLNTWMESDTAIELAKTLHEDDVIVEGYAEYPTWRYHLAYDRNPQGNPDEVVDIDGVGGVSILARASTFRHGANFPAFTFVNHAETEAFGKMSKMMGYRVGGLPHYTIWHIYEPSEDDLIAIAKMERKKRRQKGYRA